MRQGHSGKDAIRKMIVEAVQASGGTRRAISENSFASYVRNMKRGTSWTPDRHRGPLTREAVANAFRDKLERATSRFRLPDDLYFEVTSFAKQGWVELKLVIPFDSGFPKDSRGNSQAYKLIDKAVDAAGLPRWQDSEWDDDGSLSVMWGFDESDLDEGRAPSRGRPLAEIRTIKPRKPGRRALSEGRFSKALGDRGGRSSDEKAEELSDRFNAAIKKIRFPDWVYDYGADAVADRTELEITVENDDDLSAGGDDGAEDLLDQIQAKAGIRERCSEGGSTMEPRSGRMIHWRHWIFDDDRDHEY